MQVIAKIHSGSRLYQLETPQSDVDEYSVFLNTEIKNIVGLSRHDHQIKQNSSIDSTAIELRHFLNLCRTANTASYELLNTPLSRFIEADENFIELILSYRHKFMSSKRLFSCILGYANGERQSMMGTKTEKLGAKRKEAIEKYGYNFRSSCHLFRLLKTGIRFFETGHYAVSFKDIDNSFYEFLYSIKNCPQNFNPKDLYDLSFIYEKQLKSAFDNRDTTKDFIFDEDYANDCILKFYKPFLV